MTVGARGRGTGRKRTRWAVGGGVALYLAVVLAVVVAVLMPAARRMWYGEPYPTADPDVTAERLQDRSRWAYDLLDLPEPVTEAWNFVEDGSCQHRGYQYLAHWDEPVEGVIGLEHSWGVDGIEENTARAALGRLRGRLESEGWKPTHDLGRESARSTSLNFWHLHPKSGLKVNARWHDSRKGLFVSFHAPCARIPDGHPRKDEPTHFWHPDGPF
ncbi:hypothetical protein [Streptomyces glaucosporus]|uniref:hypothetical protein n=1 Tax=Streptomyces glaucosporus TaxID=284044 RepID=UPI0031D64F0B